MIVEQLREILQWMYAELDGSSVWFGRSVHDIEADGDLPQEIVNLRKIITHLEECWGK